jgi:CubicO group peptidase (beta-lactamase class C family)
MKKERNQPYFPDDKNWERKKPESLGLNQKSIEKAIKFSLDPKNETSRPKDLGPYLKKIRSKNFHDDGKIIGPTKPRGGVNGIILKDGYIVAEWGDTLRVDMSFSVSKSFLSALFGIAFDQSLIKDVNHEVKEYIFDGGFNNSHNGKITWHHFLQQTSEWVGTIWEKHYFAGTDNTIVRNPEQPGSIFEYNDCRVNRFSLSLLRIFRKPLPQVLRKRIMNPIGASNTWEWYGYKNSWITIDGQKMQSVSGGGHWGGGIWINSRDMARFGYLYLLKGKWKDKQILSKKWVDSSIKPSILNPNYGYMWWLNTNKELFPSAPEESFCALGAGGNHIYIDTVNNMVIVLRWVEKKFFNEFIEKIFS